MVKDVRVMTGALRRVDDERWEVIYRADGALYLEQALANRALAEQHLALHKELLEGVGWRDGLSTFRTEIDRDPGKPDSRCSRKRRGRLWR